MARTASLIYIVLDILKPLQHKRLIEKELEGFGIRLNQQPPNIYFKRKEKGGLNCQFLVPQDELDLDLIKTILSEYRIHNADIIVKYNATSDEFIDVVEGNRSYIPCIYLLNKIDQVCSLNSKYSKENFTSNRKKAWWEWHYAFLLSCPYEHGHFLKYRGKG